MNPNWPLVIRQIMAASESDYQDVASHCGVSKSAVDQWLQGVKTPNFRNGWALLNAYVANVSPRIPQL
jgi:transcriptional regulator with XRE-family HTH domain